jgi:hypothetical protein
VVVQQHREAGVGEGAGEAFQAVFLHPGEAVGHRDAGMRSGSVGGEQPAAQPHSVLGGEPHVVASHAMASLS